MEASQIYIISSVVVLLIILGLLTFIKRRPNQKTWSPLAGIAFAFILAGIIFGANRWVGYSLLGVGVLLAVIDIVFKLRKNVLDFIFPDCFINFI